VLKLILKIRFTFSSTFKQLFSILFIIFFPLDIAAEKGHENVVSLLQGVIIKNEVRYFQKKIWKKNK